MDGKSKPFAYLSIPMALILVLAGIFVGYAVKPYGNLQDAPGGYGKPEECAMGIGNFTPAGGASHSLGI